MRRTGGQYLPFIWPRTGNTANSREYGWFHSSTKVCEVCGATNLGRRDVEGCGRCELKAADVLSLARLGGGVAADEGEEETFE